MKKTRSARSSELGARGKSEVVAHSPQPRTQSHVADLLLEIGTEELPAAYAPGLIEQLQREAADLFEAQHLSFQRVEVFSTPRRLTLLVRGLNRTQRRPAEEIRGPSKQAAYDGDGKPSPALRGFLRSHGGTLDQVKVVSSNKGDYMYLVNAPMAVPTAKTLPDLLPRLVNRLRAPKTMRWDAGGVRFARPIRWLLALHGSTVIRCTLGTLASGTHTWVGFPKHPKAVAVKSIQEYLQCLKRAQSVLDHAARRAWIAQAVEQAAKRLHGETAPEMASHGLLDEVTHLVEQPTLLVGAFERKYLDLPREVLLASMAKYQRVFAVQSATGQLLPSFVAVLEGCPRKPAAVRGVIERILNARLADSLLFWSEDLKRPLERMAHALSGVTFHERLGSMADKTIRLRALGEVLAEAWHLSEAERSHLRKACQLAKADLVSTMVKEFPTLQGVMGKCYALNAGEASPVAVAIEEHYLPSGERLPNTIVGSALAIADKFDTLASYFDIGIEPTGDQDPFGLRRAAQGVVEVAWRIHRPLPLDRLLFTHQAGARRDNARPELKASANNVKQYLFERLYTFAWPRPPGPPLAVAGAGTDDDRRGGPSPTPSVDCLDAVLSSPCDDLIDVMDRVVSLHRLTGDPGLLKAAKVIERTRNILKGAALRQTHVDPARLREPLERQLWDLYRSNESRVQKLAQERSYAEATTVFGEIFFEPLHRFFDQVLVNVPEEALQQNRLALMQAINTLYTDRVADLSKLTILQQQA